MEPTPSAEPAQPPRSENPAGATHGTPTRSAPPHDQVTVTPTHGMPVPVQRHPGEETDDLRTNPHPAPPSSLRGRAPAPRVAGQPGYGPAAGDGDQDPRWPDSPQGPRQYLGGWPDAPSGPPATPHDRQESDGWAPGPGGARAVGPDDADPNPGARVVALESRRGPAPVDSDRPEHPPAPGSTAPVEPPPDVRTWQSAAERSRADAVRRGALSAFPRYGVTPADQPAPAVRHTGPEVVRWGQGPTGANTGYPVQRTAVPGTPDAAIRYGSGEPEAHPIERPDAAAAVAAQPAAEFTGWDQPGSGHPAEGGYPPDGQPANGHPADGRSPDAVRIDYQQPHYQQGADRDHDYQPADEHNGSYQPADEHQGGSYQPADEHQGSYQYTEEHEVNYRPADEHQDSYQPAEESWQRDEPAGGQRGGGRPTDNGEWDDHVDVAEDNRSAIVTDDAVDVVSYDDRDADGHDDHAVAAPADRNANGAGAGAGATEHSPLRPGDVAETTLAVWSDEAAQRFRQDWHEVKALFVDEPVEALSQAGSLVTAAVNEVTSALLAEQQRLDPLQDSATPDTETMRIAMKRYREFLDRILAL